MPKQLLDDNAPDRLLALGEAFLRGAASREEVLPLVAFVGLAQEELRAASAERREAARAAEEAFVARDRADEKLDARVAELSLAALALGGQDASAPAFAHLFPEGPQAITCVPVAQELEAVDVLLERLQSHPLAERFSKPLREASEAVAEADARLRTALEDEARTWARQRRALVDWRLRCKLARHHLERIEDGARLSALLDDCTP